MADNSSLAVEVAFGSEGLVLCCNVLDMVVCVSVGLEQLQSQQSIHGNEIVRI